MSLQPLLDTSIEYILRSFSQDTNSMQYELMTRLASAHGCVTIVGDPDQSSMSCNYVVVSDLAVLIVPS